jgi:peptidoglycan/LPS O-acetylase OafA/YrhL
MGTSNGTTQKIRTMSSPLKYIPALDGLRGIAILWVMLHNGILDYFLPNDTALEKIFIAFVNAGWLGVQLFFVLSGYLITRILLQPNSQSPSRTLKKFYTRRVLRIFPIYYAFLAFALIFSIIDWPPLAWSTPIKEHIIWIALHLTNWIQVDTDLGVGHLWSLAVEEQFYLVWPLIVIFFSRQTVKTICVLSIPAAIAFRLWFFNTSTDPEIASLGAYILTPARIDALLIGALLAELTLCPQQAAKIRTHLRTLFVVSAGLVIAISATHFSFSKVGSGITSINQSIAAICFACLIYFVTIDNQQWAMKTTILRVLNSRLLTNVGKHSYAMYIVHSPISLTLHSYYSTSQIWGEIGNDSFLRSLALITDLLLLFALTYLFARITWVLIEKPCLKLKHRFD